MYFLKLVHTIRFLLKFKEVTGTNQHFYELKQCQRKNHIQKSDRVNQPLYRMIKKLMQEIDRIQWSKIFFKSCRKFKNLLFSVKISFSCLNLNNCPFNLQF